MGLRTAALVCAGVGLLVYVNSLGLQFCFDDEIAIIRNQDIMSNTSWGNLLYNDFWGRPISSEGSHKSYRPLTVATFRLNYMLHELQPLGYHLVNVLLHSAVCYLYVLLCGVVFSEVWPALIAGLLFAVHPIHTEAVSGVVARADLFSGLFLLLAVLSHGTSLTHSRTVAHKCVGLLLTLLLVLCSALSKEIGITAVAICLIYELLILRKFCVGDVVSALKACQIPVWLSRLLLSSLIFGVFVMSFLVFRLVINQGSPKLTYVEVNPAVNFPTPLRQLHWSYLCVLNVWLLLSPSQLCAEYAMGTIPPIASLTDPRNLLTLATFASLLSMGCYAMRARDGHHRKLLFGLCLMIIPFIPASNLFFPVGFVIAERVLYIPSMGFTMIVAYGAWRLITNHTFKFTTKVLLIFILCVHGVKTVTRNQDWLNNVSLFSSALKAGTKDLIILNNLAVSLQHEGRLRLAEGVLKHSIEIDTQYISSYMKLAHLLQKEKRFPEAIQVYEKAEKLVTKSFADDSDILQPEGSTRVYMQLANLLLTHTQRYEEAYKLTRKAVKVEPEWEKSHNLMGTSLMKLKRFPDAITAFRKALELKGDFTGAHASLGEAHLELGEEEEAEQHFRRAMALDSQDFQSKFQLVKLIINHSATNNTDRLTEALTIARKLQNLDPENGNVTLSLAMLHSLLGDVRQAVVHMEELIRRKPLQSDLIITLCEIYYKAQEYDEAKKVLHDLLQQSPNDSSTLLKLGTISLELKEYTEARTYLERLVEVYPDDQTALVSYGLSLLHTRSNQKALVVFKKLARDFPSNPSYARQAVLIEETIQKTLKS